MIIKTTIINLELEPFLVPDRKKTGLDVAFSVSSSSSRTLMKMSRCYEAISFFFLIHVILYCEGACRMHFSFLHSSNKATKKKKM